MNLRWLPLFLLGFGPLCARAQSAVDTPSQYELGEVLVRPKYHQFQIDSAARMVIYHKVLGDVAMKPRVTISGGTSAGLSMEGGISKLARIISGREKREKAFVRDFIDDQQYRFISLRYTPQLVEAMTGLAGDTASLFMAQNPMPYDYARTASDLEVKMWIRTQYRVWNAKKLAAVLPASQETVVARP